jgi:hypothetical protein
MTTALYKLHNSPGLQDTQELSIPKSKPNCEPVAPASLESTASCLEMKMRMCAHDVKLKHLRTALKQHKARLYIIRPCVAMLITWHD